MPAPTITETWRFNVSQSIAGATPAAMRQALLLAIVNSLLGLGSWTDGDGVASSITTPWEHVSSCDSVATSSVTNLWDSSTDLVWNAEGSAHSWIILRHHDFFGEGNPLYMLINCNPNATQNATIMMSFSRAGYTGGTTTARPTATDEHIVRPVAGNVTTAGWQGDDNTTVSVSMRLHFLMTNNGRKFKIFMTRSSVCIAKWELFDCDEDEIGFSEPYLFQIVSEDFVTGAEVELLSYSNLTDTAFNWYGREQGGVGDFRAEPMIPHAQNFSSGNSLPGSPLNGFNGRWMPMPQTLRGVAPAAGPLTPVPDMWWARIAEGTGSPMRDPDLEENNYMQFGYEIVPWNNSVIVLG